MKKFLLALLLALAVTVVATEYAGAFEPVDGETKITEHHWGGGWHRGGRGGRGGGWDNGGGRGGCW